MGVNILDDNLLRLESCRTPNCWRNFIFPCSAFHVLSVAQYLVQTIRREPQHSCSRTKKQPFGIVAAERLLERSVLAIA